MEPVVFRYRSRSLGPQDIGFIQRTITQFYSKGRSHIARVLCEAWRWMQPNGQFKEYAARDLLLRLEEKGLVALPPRLRPKNNLKPSTFAQAPLLCNTPLENPLHSYGDPSSLPDRSPNPLRLPAGHTCPLCGLPQGDLSCLHHLHQ